MSRCFDELRDDDDDDTGFALLFLFPVIICYMLKASFSSLEFYAKKFVEFGLRKASFSSLEFYSFSSLEFYAKKKVRKWRRHALPYGLVMKCLCRPRNKPQHLAGSENSVRWRWKKRKFGLAEAQSRIGLEQSTLDKFCSYDHDFLALP